MSYINQWLASPILDTWSLKVLAIFLIALFLSLINRFILTRLKVKAASTSTPWDDAVKQHPLGIRNRGF